MTTETENFKYHCDNNNNRIDMTTITGTQTKKSFIPYRMIELDSYNAHSPLTYNREGITNGSERFKYLICTYIT